MERGVECLLKSQIVVDGRRTVWCQQHDVLTLRPASARNYEMPSQSAAESAGIISFLMKLPDPGTNVVAAINAGAAWLEKTQIKGFAFKKVGDEGRELTADADAGVIWARYYEIGSDRPIFGDRDKTIHDTVEEISKERRNGYAWYSASGKEALKDFVAWRSAHSR
jgi:PelA/Pel-15E family pectate lyase